MTLHLLNDPMDVAANAPEFSHVISPHGSSLPESRTSAVGTSFPNVKAAGSQLRDRDFERIQFVS
jgi:hypothetical protein